MGQCFSRESGNDKDWPTRRPSGSPPGYDGCNESCKILKQWEEDDDKSRSYQYEVYVVNNSLLTQNQRRLQRRVLERIHELAKIHELKVDVRCFDYFSEANFGSHEVEKQFYLDMLAAETRSALLDLWKNRYTNNLPGKKKFTNSETNDLDSPEQLLDVQIRRIEENPGLGDAEIKSQLQPLIVLALSKFTQKWDIGDILKHWDTVFGATATVVAEGASKLQAQLSAQARAAYVRYGNPVGGLPTISINFVPGEIAHATFDSIKQDLENNLGLLKKRIRASKSDERQDCHSIQLVSLSNRPKNCTQWKDLDDRWRGATDTIDHIPLDLASLSTQDFSSYFGRKVMLGAADHDLDRVKQGFYARTTGPITKELMGECRCRQDASRPLTQPYSLKAGS